MNPMDILKNMGNIQQKLKDSQEKIKELRASGSAGGGMVNITVSGDMNIVDITISPEIVDSNDVETLQVLIKSAHIDAMKHIKEQITEQMGGSFGLQFPAGTGQ